MDIEFLRQLLQEQEGLKLEFKQQMYLIDHSNGVAQDMQWGEFIKDILALTNGNTGTAGETGYLILGAANTIEPGMTREIFDIGDVPLKESQLNKKVNAVCDPAIADITCEQMLVDDKRVLLISIPPSPYLHETTRELHVKGKKGKKKTYSERTTFIRRNEGIGIAEASEREAIAAKKRDRFMSEPALQVQRSTLKEIAIRFKAHSAEKGLTPKALWKASQEAAMLLTERRGKDYQRFTISQATIIALFSDQSIPTLRTETVEILGEALGTPCDDLLSRHNGNRLFLEPLLDPATKVKAKNLIGEYEKKTGELCGWSDYLPCSMEPPAFMEAHHQALYGHSEDREILIETFNDIGHRRRDWVHSDARKSVSSFTQLMFKSSLEDIAKGRGDYKTIESKLRRECLGFVHDIVADPNNRIELIIAVDKEAQNVKRSLQSFDSILMFGSSLTLWREAGGTLFYSANEFWVNRHHRLFTRFQDYGRRYNKRGVLKILSGLISSIK